MELSQGWQEYVGAASLSSSRLGIGAANKFKSIIDNYYHWTMCCLNLPASQVIKIP